MSQQIIANLEGGNAVRNALNGNFAELYAALNFPLRLENISANSAQAFLNNTLLLASLVVPISGSPVLALGLTPGGGELLGSQPVTDIIPLASLIPFLTGGTIYATLSGGTVSIAFITINNVF